MNRQSVDSTADRPPRTGDKCPAKPCKGILEKVSGHEPWSDDCLQCSKCQGTWCIWDELAGESKRAKPNDRQEDEFQRIIDEIIEVETFLRKEPMNFELAGPGEKLRRARRALQEKLKLVLSTEQVAKIAAENEARDINPFGGPANANSAVKFSPISAGAQKLKYLQSAEGGALTEPETCKRLKASPEQLQVMRKKFRIVFWKKAGMHFYPRWQFVFAGRKADSIDGLEKILAVFKSRDQWRIMNYFLCPRHELQDSSPLKMIKDGKAAEVLAHAKHHALSNTW